MRKLLAVGLVVVGAGCRVTISATEEDGGIAPVDAAEPDAGIAADCPGADASLTCAAIGTCDGGTTYGCYIGSCPTGAVGACSITRAEDPITGYGEACCEGLACTRAAFGDAQCSDAGTAEAWHCPWAKGKPLAKPPGTCAVLGDVDPSIVATATGMDYCCR